jgi:RimJ/RimL family protein N-acetyltransferase
MPSGSTAPTRTPRLVLRQLAPDDLGSIQDMHAHPDVWRAYGDDPVAVTGQAQRLLDSFLGRDPERGEAPWAIEPHSSVRDAAGRKANGLIGIVGLSPTTFTPPFTHRARPCVKIAWRLARSWWGKGLVTEAAATCLAHGRDGLGLAEVVAYTSAGNERSRAVMIRLGMVPDPEAAFEHPRVAPGDPRRRHVVYRTNWAPRRLAMP